LPKRAEHTSSEAEVHQEQEIEKNFKDRIAVLAIAYHNLAVEQEFLKMVRVSALKFPLVPRIAR